MTQKVILETADNTTNLWVIVRSKNNLFGFDAGIVTNMVAIPQITHVPGRANYMAGTITVRNAVIPLIDLRIYTGQPSAEQEITDFCALMDQRLQDHQNWLTELKASVDKERQFTLATNPHQCAFGKWYDSYESDDRTVKSVLVKFDQPHRAIHGIAQHVGKALEEGNPQEAHELIDRTTNIELARMVKLFSDIKEAVREVGRRRIAMVLNLEGKKVALDVDEVVSVERLTDIENAPTGESTGLGIERIGRTNKSEEIVLLMEHFNF